MIIEMKKCNKHGKVPHIILIPFASCRRNGDCTDPDSHMHEYVALCGLGFKDPIECLESSSIKLNDFINIWNEIQMAAEEFNDAKSA